MNKTTALLAIAGTALTASAQTNILQYGTMGSTTSMAPDSADAAISADNFTAGSGLNVLAFSTFNFSGWDTASTSAADAIAANDFWQWGFDVTAAATTITLDSFDIRLDRSGTGPDDFEISYSINGGASVVVLTDDFGDSGSGRDYLGVSLNDVVVATGDSIVFTLAAFNSESDLGTFDMETIDFGGSDPRAHRIYGTVVPSPASAGLIALGGLAAARRRRA